MLPAVARVSASSIEVDNYMQAAGTMARGTHTAVLPSSASTSMPKEVRFTAAAGCDAETQALARVGGPAAAEAKCGERGERCLGDGSCCLSGMRGDGQRRSRSLVGSLRTWRKCGLDCPVAVVKSRITQLGGLD